MLLSLSVWITRFLPFIIFRDAERLPDAVDYLGRVLPASMMGLLIVYCFKDYAPTDYLCLIPALISVAVFALLHIAKHNTILSIAGGTALYMCLIRFCGMLF